MKKFLYLFLAVLVASVIRAQTNAPAAAPSQPAISKPANEKPAEQEIGVTAGHFIYDGNKLLAIYFNHVVVTNLQGKLTCERLTINLPPPGSTNSQPTNAVAETNVIIDFLDKGDTNHVTCDTAVYAYHVINAVTNNTITFHGSTNNPAKVQSAKGTMTGEPLIWDIVNARFSGDNIVMHPRPTPDDGKNTNNALPFNLMK